MVTHDKLSAHTCAHPDDDDDDDDHDHAHDDDDGLVIV